MLEGSSSVLMSRRVVVQELGQAARMGSVSLVVVGSKSPKPRMLVPVGAEERDGLRVGAMTGDRVGALTGRGVGEEIGALVMGRRSTVSTVTL